MPKNGTESVKVEAKEANTSGCNVPGCELDSHGCCLHRCWTCGRSAHMQAHFYHPDGIEECENRLRLLRGDANGEQDDC